MTGEAIERAAAEVAGLGAVTLATIWATVDIERTLADRGVEASELGNDPFLGARVVVPTGADEDPPTAIAEPSTEGRLAATLARHGEGVVGRYVAVADGLDRAAARAGDRGVPVTRIEPGPFGRSMLVLLGPVTGPHLILCEPAVPSTP